MSEDSLYPSDYNNLVGKWGGSYKCLQSAEPVKLTTLLKTEGGGTTFGTAQWVKCLL